MSERTPGPLIGYIAIENGSAYQVKDPTGKIISWHGGDKAKGRAQLQAIELQKAYDLGRAPLMQERDALRKALRPFARIATEDCQWCLESSWRGRFHMAYCPVNEAQKTLGGGGK